MTKTKKPQALAATPCERCGSADIFVEREDLSAYQARCNDCGSRGPVVEEGRYYDDENAGQRDAIAAWNRRADPSSAPAALPDAPPHGYIPIPEGLHPSTATLVRDFAEAMAKKLRASEIKHGWTANWMRKGWRDELAAELLRHVHKGDPIDVAAYAAFAWFHGWSVTPAEASATSGGQVATIIPYTDEDGNPDMADWRMIAIGLPGDVPDHVLDRIPEKEAAIICEAINHPAPQPAGTPDNPCLRKLRPSEPFFVLLGRDLHAARATRHWAEQREAERGPSPKVDGARQIADQMDAYRGDGVSSAPHPALIYPDDLTPALKEALGVPNFDAAPIAQALRSAGADIPRRPVAEQAHVLHWFVKLALQHGDDWWKVAGAEMQRIALAARQSAGEGSANG